MNAADMLNQTVAGTPAGRPAAGLHELDELDTNADDLPTRLPPMPVMPPLERRGDPAHEEALTPHRKHVLDHLIAMADSYARSGSLRQAIETLFHVAGGARRYGAGGPGL